MRLARHLERGDEPAAFRAFLNASDDLRSCPDIVVATSDEPALTGTWYGAALAALAEHHLARCGLPAPAWVDGAQRFADWVVDDSPYARANDRAQTPSAFLRHGIVMASSELESA